MLVLLCIMDGFGLRDATPDNAVAAARKPTYDRLLRTCSHTKIDGSGLAVGLPPGQMGNSEVGHLNLGAGRVVYQDITRIDKSIAEGDFFTNPALAGAMERAVRERTAVHLIGLCSDGQVHSSLEHLYALVRLAKMKHVTRLFLHCLTDGRDTTPNSGNGYIGDVLDNLKKIGVGKVATLGGRYYGMDRDKRWHRTIKQYEASVLGVGQKFIDPLVGVQASYDQNVTDEFIVPFVVDSGGEDSRIRSGDAVIFFNFRADRVRQLTKMLLNYPETGVNNSPGIELVTMTQYDEKTTEPKIAFPPITMTNILGQILSQNSKRQLRAAETEKYPHVTFFFNGGVEQPYPGEERLLVPSPKVATYDLKPEMSSVELTDGVVEKIRSGAFDFILVNYANPDMVGHTGVFEAAKLAVEATDRGLGQLLAAIDSVKGAAIVTADHGNAEMMVDPATGGPWTAHTTNLVPCILYDPTRRLKKNGKSPKLRDAGVLADIAPSVLEMLNIPKPVEMTGQSLLVY